MPNTRRRKFLVHSNISRQDLSKMQNSTKTSHQDLNAINTLAASTRNKISPNSSKYLNHIKIVAEPENVTNMKSNSVDKNVTASSSKIDLIIKLSEDSEQLIESLSSKGSQEKERETRRDKTPAHREKLRQHRIKVRSPKRRLAVMEQKGPEFRTIGTSIDWELVPVEGTVVSHETEEQHRTSRDSIGDMCRICHGGDSMNDLGQLISACSCRGTVGRVHVKCLERWLTESGKSRCELCGTRYQSRRVHRYGVAKALMMWILSQNAMQLLVDTLGIMLMSPLAVLAAWLSGRTLAGLMKQDNLTTPWPLASTFVLACMTLVCYYCWIVSAATRHALGWWIWYRSQYEVRLQILEVEE